MINWQRLRRPSVIQAFIAGLALVMLCSPSAQADEIHLADGRVLEGTIISESGADPVDIRIQSGRVTAIIHVARKDILRIDQGPSKRQQQLDVIEKRIAKAQLGMDEAAAEALWKAAKELSGLGQVIRFREVAEMVIDRNRHHKEAHEALGYRRHNGIWMRSSEVTTAEGRVLHNGRWLLWPDYQAALQKQRDDDDRRQTRRAEREAAKQQRAEERRLRASINDTSRLTPIYTRRSGFWGSGTYYHSDSLLYRYYTGCLAHPRRSTRYHRGHRHHGGRSSLNFNFGGSNWGFSGRIGY